MQDIHQLIIFWRTEDRRMFTAWHFQKAVRETVVSCAHKLLNTAATLSVLQIYGAIVDTEPLRFSILKPPPSHGAEQRLEVNIQPTLPSKVGAGNLRFSIPGPSPALCQIVNKQAFTGPEWQQLEENIIAHICSPSGIKPTISPDYLRRATIAYLTPEQQSQPDEDPFEAALARTEEALTAAKRNARQTPTAKLVERANKYQTRLQQLQQWQELEREFFYQVRTTSVFAEQPAESAAIFNQLLAATQKRVHQVMEANINREVTMSENQTAPAVKQENGYLPQAPTAEDLHLWSDLSPADYLDPRKWTHRTLLLSEFDLNERTYYRWINRLKDYGLTRSLPAQGNGRVVLFYQTDLEQAVNSANLKMGRTQAETVESLPQTTITQTTLTTAPVAENVVITPAEVSTPADGLIQAQLATLTQLVADLSKQQQSLTATIARLEANIAEQRQLDREAFELKLNQVNQQQSELTNKLPQSNFLELMAQIVSLNQIPAAFKQLNSTIKRLAPGQPEKVKSKVKPAAKTKTKVKAKTKTSPQKKTKAKTGTKKKVAVKRPMGIVKTKAKTRQKKSTGR